MQNIKFCQVARFPSLSLLTQIWLIDGMKCSVKKKKYKRTKSPNLDVSRLALQLSLPNQLKQVENEEVVGAAPIGYAPTVSEWLTILLSTEVRLILAVSR